MDSGIIRLLYYCGWAGTALLIAGVTLCVRGMPSAPSAADSIAPVYGAIVLALMFELLSGNTFTGPAGAVLWLCIGLGSSLKQAQSVSSSLEPLVGRMVRETHTASAFVPQRS